MDSPTSFLFRSNHDGGKGWSIIVKDSGDSGSQNIWGKYNFGGAMFDVNPRSDTGLFESIYFIISFVQPKWFLIMLAISISSYY